MSKRIAQVALLTLTAVAITFGGIAIAQEAATAATVDATEEAKTLEGAVKTVDVDNKMLVVVTEDGQEHSFVYTEQTKLTGLGEGAAVSDLMGLDDARVTVTYVAEGDKAWASKIEVRTPETSGDAG